MCNCTLRGNTNRWPILVLGAVLLVPSLIAWAEPITISLVPVSTAVELGGPNDPLVVDIQIANPGQEEILSWRLDLFFDPAVFDPLPGIGSVPAQGFEPGDYLPVVHSWQWNKDFEDDGVSPDTARMGAVNFGFETGSDPTGLLGRVALDVIGADPGSTLWLEGEIILSGLVEAEDVVYESTQVVVSTPEPATAVLLLAGLFAWRRRRQ